MSSLFILSYLQELSQSATDYWKAPAWLHSMTKERTHWEEVKSQLKTLLVAFFMVTQKTYFKTNLQSCKWLSVLWQQHRRFCGKTPVCSFTCDRVPSLWPELKHPVLLGLGHWKQPAFLRTSCCRPHVNVVVQDIGCRRQAWESGFVCHCSLRYLGIIWST